MLRNLKHHACSAAFLRDVTEIYTRRHVFFCLFYFHDDVSLAHADSIATLEMF